jgi:hypothetical protein
MKRREWLLSRPRIHTVALFGLSISVLSGCSLPGTDPLQTALVVNTTRGEVVVYLDYPDGETSIMELAPGESDTTNFSAPADGCAPATLIARDASGNEIDRKDQPFCVGDRWEIQE